MRTVFFDENVIGAGRLCAQNNVFSSIVYPSHSNIPEVTVEMDDVDIFDIIGENGKDLIYITRDKKITSRTAEINKLLSSGIRAFIITVRRSLTKQEQYELLDRFKDDIIRLDSDTSPPYIYRIRSNEIARYR